MMWEKWKRRKRRYIVLMFNKNCNICTMDKWWGYVWKGK